MTRHDAGVILRAISVPQEGRDPMRGGPSLGRLVASLEAQRPDGCSAIGDEPPGGAG